MMTLARGLKFIPIPRKVVLKVFHIIPTIAILPRIGLQVGVVHRPRPRKGGGHPHLEVPYKSIRKK